jgi:hypothetical protein
VGLKYCTFSSLKDIGLPLPEHSEEIVRLKITDAMLEQYEDADGSHTDPVSGLLKWALDAQKEEDGTGRGLSVSGSILHCIGLMRCSDQKKSGSAAGCKGAANGW